MNVILKPIISLNKLHSIHCQERKILREFVGWDINTDVKETKCFKNEVDRKQQFKDCIDQ